MTSVALLACACGGPTATATADGVDRAEIARSAERMQRETEMSTALAGTWTRTLPTGEEERLELFASNLMVFQRYAQLPISDAVGSWFIRDGALELDVVSCEPDCKTVPLAARVGVALDQSRETLRLDEAGVVSTWRRVAHPYGTSPGANDRAARNEISWTYKLGLARGRVEAAVR